jgi:phage terminase small subunit
MNAPAHLQRAGRLLFASIATEYAIEDAAGIALLTVAAEALDRMRSAQRSITKHGLVTRGRYGQRVANPCVAIERDARSAMLAALRALNLDLEPLRDIPGARPFQPSAPALAATVPPTSTPKLRRVS